MLTKRVFALRALIGYSLLMNRNCLFLIFVLGVAALNLGTVRRTEDPIRDTQTSGILYEQKKEEEKDGKKGPLLYSVKNSPRETFFIDPPFAKETKTAPKAAASEETAASSETSGWWEEQPAASEAAPSAETVSEPLPEPKPEAEKAQEPDAAGQPAAAPEDPSAPSGKGDDYWW